MGARSTTKKKRRRLKKGVRRGCLGIVLAAVLFIVLSVYECRRDASSAGIPVVVQPDSIPDARDSLLAARLARIVARTPRIDSAHVGLMVYDLTHRSEFFCHHSDELMVPASCQKVLTAVCAIRRLGIEHRYVNRLLVVGEQADSVLCGTVIVEMDDDPLVESFDGFADAMYRRGIRLIEGNIVFDLARRDTLRPHPTAPSWDIPYNKLPLLMRGEPYVQRQFMETLAARGIRIHRNPLFGVTWLQGLSRTRSPQEYMLALQVAKGRAREFCRITHPLRQLLAPMLIYSSNIKADALWYHTDHYLEHWRGGADEEAHAVHAFIKKEIKGRIRQDMIINDGSGLSPENRMTADFLIKVLKYAYDNSDLRDELIGGLLATPGIDERRGSLYGRMFDECFIDRVFCKTGTLATRGVSSLCGYVYGEDNRWYAFVIFNEDTPIYEAREFQDAVCRALISQ